MALSETIKTQLQDLADKAKNDGSHDVRLAALQELSTRPGIQTTEFYLSLICSTLGGVLVFIPGREMIGGILVAIGTLAYNLSRGLAKKAAPVLFFALVLAAGCVPKGYVKADACLETIKAIRGRHDEYVRHDPRYDTIGDPKFGQLASDLRDTKLLQETFEEAISPKVGVAPKTKDSPVQSGQLAPAAHTTTK